MKPQATETSVELWSFPMGKAKNNGKHAGGRPVKYTRDYVDHLAGEMVKWFRKPKNWWLKSFSLEYGVAWSALCGAAEKLGSEKFKTALVLCHELQEQKLLYKTFQPYKDRAGMFALKNVAGWRDFTAVSHSGDLEVHVHSSVPRPEVSKTKVTENGKLVENGNGNGNGH